MSNPLDNFIKSTNSNLEQGKLFHEGKNGFQQISKIVVPKIKEGNRASGIDRGISSSNTEVNNSVEIFNRKVSEYNSVSKEYNNLFQEYVESLRSNHSTKISDRTNAWEKRTESCTHVGQGGYYKSSTGKDLQECLQTCENDNECRGLSYSANPKKCFFFKSTCDAGNSGDVGKAQEMQHYSGTIDHLEKCSWQGLNNIRVRVGGNKTIESEQLKENCSIMPCSDGAIRHIDNHKTWNEAQGQLAHNCYIKDRPPWKDNKNPVWANFNKTNQGHYCGPFPGDDACKSSDKSDGCFTVNDESECKIACSEDPNCQHISYDKNRKWCLKCDNINDLKTHGSWNTYTVDTSKRSGELRTQLREKNNELNDIVYEMNQQIDIIINSDNSLGNTVRNQQKQLRNSVDQLERERDNLDDSVKSMDHDTMNGLYNDSILRKKSMHTNYLAWGFLSAAIIGISLYQIKKIRD